MGPLLFPGIFLFLFFYDELTAQTPKIEIRRPLEVAMR